MNTMNNSQEDAESPVFMVGAERSGSTLLRLMLDHHPDISFFYEFEFAVDRIPKAGWPDVAQYIDWLETNRVFQMSNLDIDPELSYPDLVKSFLAQKQANDGKPIIGATVHRDFDKLLRIWPNARFIHIIRDGRDVAMSNIKMGWAGNTWTGADRWVEAEEMWDSLSQSLPADRRMEVKFETLIDKPVQTLSAICEFMGVSYSDLMLSYHLNTSYGLPDSKMAGSWKRNLSSTGIRLAEARMGLMLQSRSYEESRFTGIKLSALMEKWLTLQDRIVRALFRYKRYGATLYLVDMLTRRLGLRAWKKTTRKNLNRIDMLHIK